MIKKTLALLCLGGVLLSGSAFGEIRNYGSVNLSPGTTTSWGEAWNLMQGDMSLSYTVDLSHATLAGLRVEVGIRQNGPADYNPIGGGWMTSIAHDLAPSPGILATDDKHCLKASESGNEYSYNAIDPNTVGSPIGTFVNYGIWFDRDGVDETQAQLWGEVNGATYNTNGSYNVVINYHAINDSQGTMFATVNGIKTGFWTAGWKSSQPDYYDVGLGFTGKMTEMYVFAGAGPAGDGDVELSGITATRNDPLGQSQVPEPMAVLLGILGLGSIVGSTKMRRR